MLRKRERIYKRLDEVYKVAKESSINIDNGTKIIIFSDQHRGTKDPADDFYKCSGTYKKALDYYYERNYILIILGDSEELWECAPNAVIEKYKCSFLYELRFYYDSKNLNRYYRIYGNHDEFWSGGDIEEYLNQYLNLELKINKLPVYEGLLLHYNGYGNIFLTHGHQGTIPSDLFSGFSKIIVRYAWYYLQRKFRIKCTTPAKDTNLAGEHEKMMYEWVLEKCLEGEKLLLITGHTHRPVFSSINHLGKVESQIKRLLLDEINNSNELCKMDSDLLEKKLRQHEFLELQYNFLKSKNKEPTMQMNVPCYFNTGCCSYPDGDITGIEISDGRIKLIKFSHNQNFPEVLEEKELGMVFNEINLYYVGRY